MLCGEARMLAAKLAIAQVGQPEAARRSYARFGHRDTTRPRCPAWAPHPRTPRSVAAITTPLGQPVRSGPRIIELAAQGLSNREAASELPPSLSWPRHNQHYQHSSRHAIVKPATGPEACQRRSAPVVSELVPTNQNRPFCAAPTQRTLHRQPAHTRRYAWFEAFNAGLFVTVRFSQHGTGSGWTAGGLMGSRGSSPVTPGRPTRSGDGCRRDG